MAEPKKTAEVTDLSVWRKASYRERRKLAEATQKELYEKPSGRTLTDDICTACGNLDRLKTRLAGTIDGIPAAQVMGKLSADLSTLCISADCLERKLRKVRRKLKRTR